MKIGNKEIGEGKPCFIIAELSANHNHDFEVAVETIRAAKKAGADAIKLQTYTADTLTINSNKEYFQINQGTLWDGKTLYHLYEEAFTPWEWHEELQKVALEEGLEFFSTPFDFTAVDFLEKLNVPVYKIASFEIFDIPLIEYVASKGKPIIISTGIAELSDIEEAVNACKRAGNEQIILLKCTSAYPAPIHEANLTMIKDISGRFEVISGLSDHTLGTLIPVISIAFGAKVIEKHFILDKNLGGPDASFSLNPEEFKKMVDDVRAAELSVGKIDYSLSEKVKSNKKFSRSLFIVEDIRSGEQLTAKNLRSIRPGYGLPPKYMSELLGKRVKKDIERGTPMSWDYLE